MHYVRRRDVQPAHLGELGFAVDEQRARVAGAARAHPRVALDDAAAVEDGQRGAQECELLLRRPVLPVVAARKLGEPDRQPEPRVQRLEVLADLRGVADVPSAPP